MNELDHEQYAAHEQRLTAALDELHGLLDGCKRGPDGAPQSMIDRAIETVLMDRAEQVRELAAERARMAGLEMQLANAEMANRRLRDDYSDAAGYEYTEL